MFPRIVTGLVGAPIILFLTYVGAPLFNLGATIAGIIGGLELSQMVRSAHNRLTLLVSLIIVSIVIAIWLDALPIALLGLLIFVVVGLLETRQQRGLSLRRYGYALGGALYIGLSMGVLTLIRAGENGMLLTFMLFINNWFTDSFALIGGRLFGKHKLAPTVSPSKTVEGALVGLTMGVLAGFVLGTMGGLPVQVALIANIVVALATETGDLIESLFKRYVHVKDSGTILPGHGGFLDRMDGTLLAAPALFVILILLG
ncbi:MAG: phosphatidate cytidylyltransferase [Anaerolineae bacterium]|nr:phosphatidate cytidylyltransferase [Anaerolineae bacterium]